MATGYRNVYSGADFISKFGGTRGTDSSRQEEADYSRQRHQYELGRMAEQERQDSVRDAARTTFSNAWTVIGADATGESPLTVARDYTIHAAKLQAYMKGGELEKGYGEYKILNSAKANGGDTLFSVATTDPRHTGSVDDEALQTGAQQITKGAFGALPVTLWTGETVTADDIYRDGSTYKKYAMGSRLTQNFTKDLVDAATGDDEFSRKIAYRIASPVASAEGAGTPNRLQYRDLGDYVFGNGEFKKLREELGDRGTERLIEDALSNGIADGTFRDRMDFVRDVVYQQKQLRPDKDVYRLVRDNLDAFNRRVKAMPKIPGVSEESVRRGVAKLMTMAAEEAPDAIDFNDERTNARLDRWAGLMSMSEQFGIPLLVDSHEAGKSLRKSLGDSLSYQSIRGEPDETNALVRYENAFRTARSLVSSGSLPVGGKNTSDGASALGFTSGDPQLDMAMKTMVSHVLKDHVLPKMYRGMREDVALRELATDQGAREALVNSWGDALSVFTGLSADAGKYVASLLVARAFGNNGGSVVPVDPKSELTAAAFDRNTPDGVAKDLRVYIKAKNLVDDTRVTDMLIGYRRMLSDPLVGWGMKDKNMIDASMADMKRRVVSVLEKGQDPNIVAEFAASHGFPYKWTGSWMLPDGSVVSDEDYREGQFENVDEKGRKSTVRFDKKTAVPVIDKERHLTNLNSMEVYVPGYGGIREERMPAGSWLGNESGFLGAMSYMRSLYMQQQQMQAKRLSDAVKASGGSGSGGINID